MHVAILSGGSIPNPTSGGGALTTYAVLRSALDAGHRVTAFALHDRRYWDPSGADVEARVAHLRTLGADVVPIESVAGATPPARTLRARARRVWSPPLEELQPHVLDGPELRGAIEQHACDVAFAYNWEPLAASRGLAIPRVAGVGDPAHLPRFYRWKSGLPAVATLRSTLHLQAAMRGQPGAMAALLEECASYGAFAAHHAAWLRSHGAPRCLYLHTPLPDEAGPGWESARATRAPGEPMRLLLLGHLAGTVTTNGLRVFAKMLPELDRLLGTDGYVVDVVGGYDPPADLASMFAHPSVRRHGHAEDASPWLRAADALVVPTSIPLGIRVRIVTGLSFGTPVVTHRANALGIPELEHGVNALLGASPSELAGGIARLAADDALRSRLSRAGRATYERYFSLPVAGGAIVSLLEEAARG